MADDNSGAPEVDPQFEPVHKLTEQVAVSTGEEGDIVIFKMRAKLFRFDKPASEWKERGTGEVKILQPQSGKIRLVMRRDKTLKVCANHIVNQDMTLAPNIGSDRSWVWNVAADVSDGEPTQETLAIRFANAENAGLFKTAFEDAQEKNAAGVSVKPEESVEAKEQAASAAADAPEATPKAADQASANESSTPAEPSSGEKKEAAVVDAEENSGPASTSAEESKSEEVAKPAAVADLKEEEKHADETTDVKATHATPAPEPVTEVEVKKEDA